MNHVIKRETIVIFGGWRQTLTVLRSLSRAGYRVELIGIPGTAYLTCSQYVDICLDLPDFRYHPEEFLVQLNKSYTNRNEHIFFYPIGNREIDFALRFAERLPGTFNVIAPSRRIFDLCQSKSMVNQYCEQAGLPCIKTIKVKTVDEVLIAAHQIGFPVLLKGDNESIHIQNRKAMICPDPQHLADFLTRWTFDNQPVLIQPYLKGQRVNVSFFAVAGQVLAEVHIRVLWTNMADGTGVAVEGISISPNHLLSTYTHKLVAEMAYEGVGNAQYLLNETTGQAFFLEINARLDADEAANYRFGLNQALLSVTLAAHRDEVYSLVAGARIAIGKRYASFLGDLRGLSNSLIKGYIQPSESIYWIVRLLLSQMRADFHITWDWRDPGPTLCICYDYLAPWRPRPNL